jgi:hypothetical protein
LKRRTSINSIFQTHKEKEMADFRKLFYALALVAMLAGLTIPASAQNAPFTCSTAVTVPPIVRGEGYAELVGDLVLTCSGGNPTTVGQTVPQVNISIFLNTNVTSKLTAAPNWNEALLLVDEPHSPTWAGNTNAATGLTHPILNCGASGAPDNGTSGAGVCSITSTGIPGQTYDGTGGVTTTFGSGRPNVFQGRTGSTINTGQFNAVSWLGVPLDPPGSTTTRTLRFTNIRADAEALGIPLPGTLNFIQANITINGNTSVAINNGQQNVALVQKGLVTTIGTDTVNVAAPVSFLQCNSQNAAALGVAPVLTGLKNTPATPTVTFTEGFPSSFKAKNIAHILNQTPASGQAGNGRFVVGGYWQYNGFAGTSTFNYPSDFNQNVPGAIYNTETGFTNQGPAGGNTLANDPNPNPPLGIGTTAVAAIPNQPFSSSSTGIANAGVASQGTRLAVAVTNVPTGLSLFAPTAVYLTNTPGGSPTGVAVLTSTDAQGAGAYTPTSASPSTTTFTALTGGLAVYEVLFADPFSVESASVPIAAAWITNLSSNSPQPGITANVQASFAPFYGGSLAAAAKLPSLSLPVPRFIPGPAPTALFSLIKCACDILFPYAVSLGGFDTGIVIANTSTDPGAAYGFHASPQSGAVSLWYYGVGVPTFAGNPQTNMQCTNTGTPGSCTGALYSVASGQFLAFPLSTGNASQGVAPVPGFQGYIIAQAAFQYCHAYAYISALGAGATAQGASEGYVALILDNLPSALLSRTGQSAEHLDH